ncbi:hypothetical protein ACCS64_38070, partial [Rhizobium ruizarguesonis]
QDPVDLDHVAAFHPFQAVVKRDPASGDRGGPRAAISCGIFASQPVIDLDYIEDSSAETDANFVMKGTGGIVEIQGTAEGTPFSESEFTSM